jgi:DNA-binding transcriptional ArsR family regulator
MVKKNWTLLSNHGRILAYLAQKPQVTTQSLAYVTGLSIRGVQIILDDLEKGGYLVRQKVGRNNRYEVNPQKPLRHHLESHLMVSDILLVINAEQPKNGGFASAPGN